MALIKFGACFLFAGMYVLQVEPNAIAFSLLLFSTGTLLLFLGDTK